jgi:hypothetical protein
MTTSAMRKKLSEYMQTADIKKVRAIYTMVEDDMTGGPVWDKDFIEEIDHREKSFLDGSAQMYTLEEARLAAIARVNPSAK